jgi:hypothetical protein
MRALFFVLTFLCAMHASAADASRCGTDAFGNDVCLDKDGVLTPAPVKSPDDRSGVNANGEKAGSMGDSGKTGREIPNGRVRCGIDPFGNKVCR